MAGPDYTASGGDIKINQVAQDSAGDTFLVGSLNGTATIDGGSITSTAGTGGSGFVAKINADGSLGWTQLLGGATGNSAYDDNATSLAVSADGNNVYVGVSYIGTLDLPGGGSLTSPTTNNYGAILQLSGSTGDAGWNIQIGSNGNAGTNSVSSLALDGNGNLYASGGMYDLGNGVGVTFPKDSAITDGTGATNTTDLTSNTSYYGEGLYVLKADASTGALTWASPVNTAGGDINGSAVAVDGSGHVYMVGQLYSVQFGASAGNDASSSGNNFGAFLVSVDDSTGAFGTPDVFSSANETIGSSTVASAVSISAVTIDSSGNPIVAGSFGEGAKLTPGSSTEQTGLRLSLSPSSISAYGDSRAFVEKFNTSLSSQWLATESGTAGSTLAGDFASGIGVTSTGGVAVVGTLGGNAGGTSQFGSNSISSPGSSTEGFVWTLNDASGATTGAGAFSTTGTSSAPTVTVTNGDIVVGVDATTTTNVNPLGSTPDDVSPGASPGFIAADVGTPPPCYCAGSRIATPTGEVPVERLAVGDKLATLSGEAKPIKWIGHRLLDCSRRPNPESVWPVRVAAGAFGEGRPSRDLWLSPGHSVAVDGVLIPIRHLLNGHSIVQVETAAVEYWHVELDQHDILLAQGLPAESYLDCGNRNGFVNGGAFIEAHPDFEPKDWRETCLPLVERGPEVARAKARLLARLFDVGHEVTRGADAHVLAGGRRIEPIWLSQTRLAFALPEGCASLVLKSHTFVPAHTRAESFDERELGLCVARLQIDGDDVALEDAALSMRGWHGRETDDEGRFQRRWTRGEALLPAGARLALVDLAGYGYYWREPRAAERASAVD